MIGATSQKNTDAILLKSFSSLSKRAGMKNNQDLVFSVLISTTYPFWKKLRKIIEKVKKNGKMIAKVIQIDWDHL
jgi:hypothetical protein